LEVVQKSHIIAYKIWSLEDAAVTELAVFAPASEMQG